MARMPIEKPLGFIRATGSSKALVSAVKTKLRLLVLILKKTNLTT